MKFLGESATVISKFKCSYLIHCCTRFPLCRTWINVHLTSARNGKRKFGRKLPVVSQRNSKQEQLVCQQRGKAEKLDQIKACLEHLSHKSLKYLAQEVGVSKGTPRTTTKSLTLHPYKTIVVDFAVMIK
jgi:hypothetical protein